MEVDLSGPGWRLLQDKDAAWENDTLFLPPGRVNKPMFGFNAKAFGDVVMIYEVVKKGAAEKAGHCSGT